MQPDITFILSFKGHALPGILSSLGEFCVNTDTYSFDPSLVTATGTLSFYLDLHEEPNWYYNSYDHSRKTNSKILVGYIRLGIKQESTRTILEFWPCNSQVAKVCMKSSTLKNAFIRLLEKQDGLDLQVGHSNGNIELVHSIEQ